MIELTRISQAPAVAGTSLAVFSLAFVTVMTSSSAAAQGTAATPVAVPTQQEAATQATTDTVANQESGLESPLSGNLQGQAGEQAAPQLGRLFLTPEQRRLLDELRNRKPLPAQAARAIEPQVEPEPEPELEEPEGPVVSELTINGMVLRKGGLSAAWVNGAPIQTGSVTREGIVVRTGRGSVRVVLPSGAQSVRLKPGQKVDVVSGSVYEPYDLQKAEVGGTAFDESSAAGPSQGDVSSDVSASGRDGSPVEDPISLRDILLRLAAPR